MRRHSKNNCCLACMLGTGAAVWFMYYMVYSSADIDHFSMLDMYGSPPQTDRWAAIKGDDVVHVMTRDDADDEADEFDDTTYRKMAPPESQAFEEQGMVEKRLMNPPVSEDDDQEEKVRPRVTNSKIRGSHPKHAHPKVEQDDQTTVGVTVSTTAAMVTTSMPVTTVKMKVSHEQPKPVLEHAHPRQEHPHQGHPHEQKKLEEQPIEAVAEEPETQDTVPIVEKAPEYPQEGGTMNETDKGVTEHAPKHGTAHEVTHSAKTHEHEHSKSHRTGEHAHHHPDKADKRVEEEDGVTPAIEDSDDQVQWTPEDLLVQNKTASEADNSSESMEQLLAFAQIGRLEERQFELANLTYTNDSEPGASVTTKLNMNETKPTNEELQLKMIEHLPDAPQKSETVNWEKFFSFIPNGLQFCTELFPNLANQNPLPQGFQEAYMQFQKAIQPFNIKDNNIAEHLEQFIVYYFLVRAPFVKTICETGFGAGHSAFLWLHANPDVKVHMFDLGLHAYSIPIAEYLSSQFPGRLNVVWGDSVNTLPMFRQANKDVTCDIVVIDGGHTFRESFADYFHLRQMVNKNNIVLLDNYPDISKNYMEILGAVWEGGKRRGEINEIFHCDYRPRPHGFSVGRFIPYTLSMHEAD